MFKRFIVAFGCIFFSLLDYSVSKWAIEEIDNDKPLNAQQQIWNTCITKDSYHQHQLTPSCLPIRHLICKVILSL